MNSFIYKMALSFALFSVATITAAEKPTYYFNKEPFVHPAIIEDLSNWVSDSGDQVVSINVTESNHSNRYFGEYKHKTTEYGNMDLYHNSGNPYVYIWRENACKEGNDIHSPSFGYDLIGKIDDIYILHTSESSCGTGVWHDLIFLKLEEELGFNYIKAQNILKLNKKRIVVHKLGEIPLGDRYEGFIRIDKNNIIIGKDTGMSVIFKKDTVLSIKK